MRTKFIFHMLLMVAVVFLASCVKEGPAGLAGLDGTNGTDGADGADGQDGSVTCMACHTGTTIAARQFEYAISGHNAAVYLEYTSSAPYFASCAECHNGTGFIAKQTQGAEYEAMLLIDPDKINCTACHPLHSTFTYNDFGFRVTDAVDMVGGSFNKDDGSNLCATCHQTRRPEPNIDVPGETYNITSTHYGPHHGPQANLFAGVGFAEIAGSFDYPVAGSTAHTSQTSCVTCHMGDFDNQQGGHSFSPSLESCQACHATSSFDYSGKQTVTEEQLHELRGLLITLGVVEYVIADEAYEPVVGTHPMVQVQGFFNWVGIEEDRSLGVHNPKYVSALLLNSIEAMKAEVAKLP